MLVLLCFVLSTEPTHAETGPEDADYARRAHAFSRELMSPYCPGRTLADCPSPDAAALRQEIRELLDAGTEEEVILDQLEARFGQAIYGVPRGFWGWALPGLVLLGGAAFLVSALRRLSDPGVQQAPPVVDPELERELERELES